MTAIKKRVIISRNVEKFINAF